MKNIKYLFYIIAAVFTLGLASCSNEEEFEPGKPDLPGCHQVSFVLEANNDFELDPKAPTSLTFKAKRASDVGKIEVPVVVTDAEGVFEFEPIIFEDGQEETEFVVNFDQADVGKEYSCTIAIEDPEYASTYTSEPVVFTFVVTRVKWNKLVAKDGTATGRFREGFICDLYGTPAGIEVPVEVYERSDQPGLFKVINPYGAPMLAQIFGATEEQVAENVKDTEFIINATNPNKVWVPFQNVGCFLNPKEGWIFMASDVKENGRPKESYGFYEKSTGVITFPKNGLLFGLESMPGKLFNANAAGLTRLILPGGQPIDYTVSAQPGQSKEGKLPVKLLIGPDVAKTKYACFEGTLKAPDIPYKAKDVASDENAKVIEGSGEKAIELEFEKTGVYTVLFTTFNDKGEYTGKYTTAEVKYVAAGDDSKKVVLDCGLIVSDKHIKEGYTAENSVEVWITGSDIEELRWGVYKQRDFEADQNAVLRDLIANKTPMTAEELAEVNAGIFTGVVSSLNSGTDFVLLVYASNGFEDTFLIDQAKTEGIPNPRYDDYTANSFVEALIPKEISQYYGDYNLYAINLMDKEQTQRAVLAESTIKADSDTSLVITNMMPALIEKGEVYSSLKFDFLDGLLGSLPIGFDKFEIGNEEQKGYVAPFWLRKDGKIAPGQLKYALVASYVADGIIAFVPNPFYASEYNVVFTGVYCGVFDTPELGNLLGGMCGYHDYLLIRKDLDPEKAQKKAETALGLFKENRKQGYVDYSVNFIKKEVESSNEAVKFNSVNVDPTTVKISNNKEFKLKLKNSVIL